MTNTKKIRAEIERLMNNNHTGTQEWIDAKECAYMQILRFIDSLQHEQLDGLHFTPLNRLIQKIPSEKWNDSTNNYAKKLRDCLIKEGYQKDAEVLQGYISYMNGNNVPMATMDEHEKLPKEFWDKLNPPPNIPKDINCIWYKGGERKKGLPGTKCDVVGCVAYISKAESILIDKRGKRVV